MNFSHFSALYIPTFFFNNIEAFYTSKNLELVWKFLKNGKTQCACQLFYINNMNRDLTYILSIQKTSAVFKIGFALLK